MAYQKDCVIRGKFGKTSMSNKIREKHGSDLIGKELPEVLLNGWEIR
jgi:hypothetical protein